jgi:hypothetical protein
MKETAQREALIVSLKNELLLALDHSKSADESKRARLSIGSSIEPQLTSGSNGFESTVAGNEAAQDVVAKIDHYSLKTQLEAEILRLENKNKEVEGELNSMTEMYQAAKNENEDTTSALLFAENQLAENGAQLEAKNAELSSCKQQLMVRPIPFKCFFSNI